MIDTSANSSFSRALPGLQLAVDSTSLTEFKRCARRYYYMIVLGYQSKHESVDLAFGILAHSTRERYDHLRAAQRGHEDALEEAIAWLLKATWKRELGRPWLSGDPVKNRLTLVRTMVWYLDKFENDPLRTVILADGRPAVELAYAFDPGFEPASTGEKFLLCGHLDRLAQLGDAEDAYVVDLKSTKHSLDARYFSHFTPHTQFSGYIVASKVVFHLPVVGLIVDAAQVLVSGSRFERALITRSEEQNEEFLRGTSQWLRLMDEYARTGEWPMNESSCGMYGGCQFRDVCAKSPGARQVWLDAGFRKRSWDPLARRGDV